MRPPFLEAHLKREPATIQKSQLLWQFYVKDGQPLRAAEVLTAVAESQYADYHPPVVQNMTSSNPRVDLALETRIEYLTLAVGNAKSHPISIGGKHESAIAFLTDLEEKLEVAQVQLELYNTLVPLSHNAKLAENVVEKIKLLPKRLFTISEVR
jgi:nuclear pore complex protein Nup155